MAHVTQRPRTVQVPDDARGYVAALVKELGPRRAAERLTISRHAALAVALGAPVTRGTLAIVREVRCQCDKHSCQCVESRHDEPDLIARNDGYSALSRDGWAHG
jgi:hypothetical protein